MKTQKIPIKFSFHHSDNKKGVLVQHKSGMLQFFDFLFYGHDQTIQKGG